MIHQESQELQWSKLNGILWKLVRSSERRMQNSECTISCIKFIPWYKNSLKNTLRFIEKSSSSSLRPRFWMHRRTVSMFYIKKPILIKYFKFLWYNFPRLNFNAVFILFTIKSHRNFNDVCIESFVGGLLRN